MQTILEKWIFIHTSVTAMPDPLDHRGIKNEFHFPCLPEVLNFFFDY